MRIEFWGATREVTGSCYLIRIGDYRILVECGLIQGSRADEARNRDPFPFDPSHIDAVILTHAHLDHSGRLPLLISSGFRGPIYTHPASRDLCRIMLKDAGYLNERETEWENRKRMRKHLPLLEPLYTMDQAQLAIHQFKTLEYEQIEDIVPGMKIRLKDAGHILGSAIVEMWLEENGKQCKLAFSGDLGHYGAPILKDPKPVEEADLVILESTYGDRLHRSWEDTWLELKEVFVNSKNSRGNILIPSFAVGRTQELLYTFGQNFADWHLDEWTIFLDSPMAIEATEVYARHSEVYDKEAAAEERRHGNPFMLPNLHFSRTVNQSMGINKFETGAIIIAGSGMCDGGRIKHHLKHNIWRKECHLVMVGFQARGTLGRKIVDGARYIRLWGETIRVAAQIHTVGGLSAHADCNGLVNWYRQFQEGPAVALVHGEPQAMDPLASRLRDGLARQVIIPEHGTTLDLATLGS